jgi:glutamate synthase domain-containing protein 2
MSGQTSMIKSLESLKPLVAEALSYKCLEEKTSWGLADAKKLYEAMPIIRGYCGRIEQILHDIGTIRSQVRIKIRDVQFQVQEIEDAYVEAHTLSLTSKGLSWEERASYRRIGSIEVRKVLKEHENTLEIIDLFYTTVERHYRHLMQAKQDIQTSLKLLQVGSILGDIKD